MVEIVRPRLRFRPWLTAVDFNHGRRLDLPSKSKAAARSLILTTMVDLAVVSMSTMGRSGRSFYVDHGKRPDQAGRNRSAVASTFDHGRWPAVAATMVEIVRPWLRFRPWSTAVAFDHGRRPDLPSKSKAAARLTVRPTVASIDGQIYRRNQKPRPGRRPAAASTTSPLALRRLD